MNPCPVCLSNSFAPLIDFGVAARSGSYLSGPDKLFDTVQLTFEFCTHCALIKRLWTKDESFEYTQVDRMTGHQLPDHALEIVDSLQSLGLKRDELIVEVGANDGAFLEILDRAGFANRLGIEPSVTCASVCSSKGERIENVHLNPLEAERIIDKYGPAHAVICRHTLEHVPEPVHLLQAMQLLLHKEGVLFIEVPNSRNITEDLRGYELWDEHLHYFTPENLSLVLSRVGFSVSALVQRSFKDLRTMCLWCRPNPSTYEPVQAKPTFEEDFKRCGSFSERWRHFSEEVVVTLGKYPKPISCIGASHNQTNFLLFSGVGQYTDLLIDDDPIKKGCYAPVPKPVPIISTVDFLGSVKAGTALGLAFGYPGWMDKIGESFSGSFFRNPFPSITNNT